MIFNRYGWVVLGGLWVSSCVQVIDLAPPAYDPKGVVTCFLNPDSSLSVRVSQSVPVDDTTKSRGIARVRVTCYEDGQFVGTCQEAAQGVYTLAYTPRVNHRYRIEAVLPNGSVLSGEDQIPPFPVVSAGLTGANPDNINQNPDVQVVVAGVDTLQTRLWISFYLFTRPVRGGGLQHQVQTIQSSSSLLDPFNTTNLGSSIKREWRYYARLRPERLGGEQTLLMNTFNSVSSVLPPQEQYFMQVIAGSRAFDQYLKSYITAYENRLTTPDGGLINPFAEPTPVYSNIHNGLGVVVALQSRKLVLREGR